MYWHLFKAGLSAGRIQCRRAPKHSFMNLRRLLQLSISSFITVVAVLMGTACDAEPEIVDHSFEFDALTDSPGIEILDFRYGDTKFPGARNPDYLIREGRSFQRTGITGAMRKPDTLYVKWRILSDNTVHEDTVDLRRRLPKDLADRKVYFLVRDSQLYVYVISRQRRAVNSPPAGPEKYRDRTVLTIYPDQ